MRLTLQWKILLGYLVIAGIGMGTAGWLALNALEAGDMDHLRSGLTVQARIAAHLFATPLAAPKPDSAVIDAVADQIGDDIHARVTVINPEGLVLGDSYESGEGLRRMDNHLTRPEVRQALADGIGSSARLSDTVGIRMLNLALPIRSPGPENRLLGLVRLSLPLTDVEARQKALRGLLAAALGGAFLLSLAVSYLVAGSITRPLSDIVAAARRMAHGEFHEKIRTHSDDEVAELGGVLNQMAGAIQETIKALKDDRAKMAATLTAMQEGVVVLASNGTVRLINPAMERMVGRREEDVVGRPYLEVIRHPRLNEFITEVLTSGTPASTEINLRTGSEQTFQVQASPLAQGSDRTPGLVLVFHDITDLRRLEQVRKDLVANVSHELRTPLTAIKGYAEALQDSSQDDPAQRQRFLEIIGTHTDHLNLIITDLLLLSKIESGQIPLTLEPVEIPALVDRTLGLLRHAIERKQHKIVTDLPDRLPPALGDEERLGQVLTNLLDNAVKYTPDHGTITVTAAVVQEMIEICVEDTGIGIPPKDLPRIFERFYRVDKARSRELGGTGLGLAIVKHLVEGNRGSVTVENLTIQGTRFRVRLPMATTLSFSRPAKETE